MTRRPLFQPDEYRELTADELTLLQTGYREAVAALKRNITEKGFSACSLADNRVSGTDSNYRSVWARDGGKTPEPGQCVGAILARHASSPG